MSTTVDQISEADFRAYERVRQGGRFNMMFPDARKATGLDMDTYQTVMSNYGALVTKYLNVREEEQAKTRPLPCVPTASCASPLPGALEEGGAGTDRIRLMAEIAVCGVMWRDAKTKAAEAEDRYKVEDARWGRAATHGDVPDHIQQAYEAADDARGEADRRVVMCEEAFWLAVDAFAAAQIQATAETLR
jgi:hypothetical protein